MPTVPIVEKDVRTAPLQVQQLGKVADPYVANTGATELFKAVGDIYETQQKQTDQVSMVEAQKKLDEWEAVNLFGPQNGALARQGKDTANLTKTYTELFDKDFTTYRETLQNARQKQMFDEMAVSRRGTIQRQLAGYEREQMESYADAISGATAESGVNRAALYFNTPDIRESSINSAKAAILSRARVKGLPDEAVKGDIQKVESKARLGALLRYADNQPKEALDFFNEYAASFTAEDLLQAQRVLAPVQRMTKANDIFAKVYSPEKSELEMAKEIDEETDDLNVAQEAKKNVSDQIKLTRESKEAGWTAANDDAWRYVMAGQSVPPSVEGKMNPKDVVEMRKNNPDPNVYNELRGKVITGQDVNLGEYRWKLGEKGYADLLELQQNPEKNVTAKTVDEMIKSASPYIIGTDKAAIPKNAQKLDEFRRFATKQVTTEQQVKGRPLTEDEKQKIMDRMLVNIRVNRFGIDDKKMLFQVEEGDDVYIQGIPKERAYKINGQDATYADLVDTLIGEAGRRNVRPTADQLNEIFEELSQPGGAIKWGAGAKDTKESITPPKSAPAQEKPDRMGAVKELAPLIRELVEEKKVPKAKVMAAIREYYGQFTPSSESIGNGMSVIKGEIQGEASYDELAQILSNLAPDKVASR